MKKSNSISLIIITGFFLFSCGGGDGSSNSPDPIKHGPLAGTWQGEAKDIIFTLYVDGGGPSYSGHIETSNSCYIDTSCVFGVLNKTAEIICHGYVGNFYTMLFIYGEYDGDKTITGEIDAEFCNGLMDHAIVLEKIANIQ